MLGTKSVQHGLDILMHCGMVHMQKPIMICAKGNIAAMDEIAIDRSWSHNWQQKRHMLCTCGRACLLRILLQPVFQHLAAFLVAQILVEPANTCRLHQAINRSASQSMYVNYSPGWGARCDSSEHHILYASSALHPSQVKTAPMRRQGK